MFAPTNFEPNKIFLFVKISMQVNVKLPKQYQKDLTDMYKARTFWEAAVDETVVCVLVPAYG